MISPIHIISISLGVAFALGFAGKSQNKFSAFVMLVTLGVLTYISAAWANAFIFGDQQTVQIFTAGYKPPFSINLQIGFSESVIILLVNFIALLGALYLFDTLVKAGKNAIIVYLIFVMSLNQIILTQDIFNLFVFLEIQSIATAGLIVLEQNKNSIASGFKYMIASGIISSILLIGIVFGYYFTGSLNIADFINANMMLTKGGAVALFMILVSLLLELKPFPANGWALDVYQSIKAGTSAMLSAASATAVLFALYKIMPASTPKIYEIILGFGLFTFVGSNMLGIKQKNPQRLLGYSSVGQIGLIVAILGLKPVLGEKFTFVVMAIFISHFLAKAGLFWLSGILKSDNIKDWANLRKKPFLLVLFGTFVFTLIGFPPFPSFFGKWELIMQLSQSGYWYLVGVILLGSFFEGIYLFKWLGYAIKLDNANLPEFNINWKKIIPVAFVGILTYITGFYSAKFATGTEHFEKFFVPLFFIAILYFLDFLPNFVKNIIAIAGMSYYGYILLPGLYETDLMRFIFAAIFIIGGVLTLIAGFTYKGQRKGFHPAALMMFAGLGGIIQASNLIEFFFSWEMMTLGSYILIIRGKKSMPHGLSYMLFSLAGAYLILAAFGFTFAQNGISLEALKNIAFAPNLIYGLLAVGFMTKTASLGLHIWLPGAHAEAESDVSPMVSAILLKAGVFGLIILFMAMGSEAAGRNSILYLLGWLGAITALVGNTAAAFQEDAKKLLAYSSIGQLGYILFGFSLMTHLGWLAGFTYSINHFLFKAVLFLAVGAVVLRVKTHNMYEMGGLIKRMPFAFIAVLIGIITLAGIPPLSGFAGKWLFYNAVIEKGWYFQGTIVFFAGTIAFLYCFRLIHSIFLGQLKDNHRKVKDISVWFIIPIYTLIAGIMIFSARPDLILKPIGNFLMPYFPTDALSWTDTMAKTRLGYWDGHWVMIIIGIMFSLIFAWLYILSRKATKVEQFNITYSGERPERPETTHIAHNMYAGFYKAVGLIVAPFITQFWQMMSETVTGTAGYFRRIYNGNGQTYALHIIIYTLAVYLMIF